MLEFKRYSTIKDVAQIGTINKARNWFLGYVRAKNKIGYDNISVTIEKLDKSQKVIKVVILGNLVLQNDDIYNDFKNTFKKPLLIRCFCSLTVLENLTIEELEQRIIRILENGTKVDDCNDFFSEVCNLLNNYYCDCNSEIYRCLKTLCEESERNEGSNGNCITDSLTQADIEKLQDIFAGLTKKPVEEQLVVLYSILEEEKWKKILDCEDKYSVKIGDYLDTLRTKLR